MMIQTRHRSEIKAMIRAKITKINSMNKKLPLLFLFWHEISMQVGMAGRPSPF
ncbi:glycerophosphodiester phosphodiesterase [Prevotella dentalis DSM 3688]|uniref:Glycerophosphodiester phosphodiesterase n=1 Tax=Prevotella dentalis (strain ATCC 49559 / DSM 3688 / JCM 13448 / NCTC 12043 / ES 2772) TaxID=908937 RepID=F9D4X4_PREDD|nr:glycerophosphodiester phosphodiesterase [Prevotella dentalis DSM 3688]